MLKAAVESVQGVAQERFDRIFYALWAAHRRKASKKAAVAVSGGVDSMALASLCQHLGEPSPGVQKPSFRAFIVDHGLRHGSTEEALMVADQLRKMEMECDVLTLDWKDIGDPKQLSNLETIARRLRFQALGRACATHNISRLLLAHHGDDQAETVLSRIYSGYTGLGLRGIQYKAPIPECHGMYDVSEAQTGYRINIKMKDGDDVVGRAVAASGGVNIDRPLLGFSKDELLATCQQREVRWFEDATNADKTLTLRNTIRHLFQHHSLPAALSPKSLRLLAENKGLQRQSYEEAATNLYDACHIELDTCSGIVSFRFPQDIKSRLASETNPTLVAALLLQRLLQLTERISMLGLQNLYTAVEFAFPFILGKDSSKTKIVAIGNVILFKEYPSAKGADSTSNESRGAEEPQYDITSASQGTNELDQTLFKIHPRPPARPETFQCTLIAPRSQDSTSDVIQSSGWQLFHDRFWISLHYIPHNIRPGLSLIVRLLTKADIATIRAEKVNARELDMLLRYHAPGNVRFTLPAIVERSEIVGTDGVLRIEEVVCALPSIGWSRSGSKKRNSYNDGENPWNYACRYKMIRFGASPHQSARQPPPWDRVESRRKHEAARAAYYEREKAKGLDVETPTNEALAVNESTADCRDEEDGLLKSENICPQTNDSECQWLNGQGISQKQSEAPRSDSEPTLDGQEGGDGSLKIRMMPSGSRRGSVVRKVYSLGR